MLFSLHTLQTLHFKTHIFGFIAKMHISLHLFDPLDHFYKYQPLATGYCSTCCQCPSYRKQEFENPWHRGTTASDQDQARIRNVRCDSNMPYSPTLSPLPCLLLIYICPVYALFICPVYALQAYMPCICPDCIRAKQPTQGERTQSTVITRVVLDNRLRSFAITFTRTF